MDERRWWSIHTYLVGVEVGIAHHDTTIKSAVLFFKSLLHSASPHSQTDRQEG